MFWMLWFKWYDLNEMIKWNDGMNWSKWNKLKWNDLKEIIDMKWFELRDLDQRI